MVRGTTPTEVLTVKDIEAIEEATDVWVTFEQGSTEITRKWKRYPESEDDNDGIAVDGNIVTVKLSQEDTLSFAKGSVSVLFKMLKNDEDDATKYDDVGATEIKKLKVAEILNEDVM